MPQMSPILWLIPIMLLITVMLMTKANMIQTKEYEKSVTPKQNSFSSMGWKW